MTERFALPFAVAVALAVVLVPIPAWGQDVAPGPSLHLAALGGDLASVRRHIAAGADLDARDAYGSTPLVIAATFGHADVAQALIEGGADLAIPNPEGSTPLHVAALFGRTEIVQMLLENGAKMFSRNGTGSTAYDIVAAPIDWDRALYDRLQAGLGPLGLTIDTERIGRERPRIAALLQPRVDTLAEVGYAPTPGDGWSVSRPSAEGLDPEPVAVLYADAAEMDMLRALLVVRNGRLIAEGYFNGMRADQPAPMQSVTKSVTSALVGIALDWGCLTSVDQPMMDFFPELVDQVSDPRKAEITVRHLLQMRAGYPWEESTPALFEMLYHGFGPPLLAEVALVRDPGTQFDYSSLSSHLLGIIVARACDTDLKTFATTHLFEPLGMEVEEWTQDWEGYFNGHADLRLTAREAAAFGLLYLDEGVFQDRQIVPADWVAASLRPASENVTSAGVEAGRAGRHFHEIGYGYQWWTATVGDHAVAYAWGHGGQLVVLVEEMDLVVVALSDPMVGRHDAEAWGYELAALNVIGRFLRTMREDSGQPVGVRTR